MDYRRAINELNAGKLHSVYLLWGTERFLREDLLQKIKKQVAGERDEEYGLTVLNGKDLSVDGIIEAADTIPFFAAKQTIIIDNWYRWRSGKENGEEKQRRDEQKLIDYMTNRLPPFSCLIFTSDEKIDRRKKLYQTVEKIGAAVELSPLKGRALEGWISQTMQDWGKKMAPGVLAFIVSEAGASETVDLLALKQELAKIALYTGTRPEVTQADVRAVFTRTPESSVFMLVDAVSRRQKDKALHLWADLKVTGQEPLKLLNLLARQIRLIWQAKQLLDAGCTADQIAGRTGMHPYVAQKVTALGKNFSVSQLRQALTCIQEADWAVKSGRWDQETMMALLIVSLCNQ